MNLTIGSKHFQVSLGVLAGAAIALFLFLHFGGSSIAIDNWLASGKQEVQAVHGVLARHASYVRQAAAARKKLGDSLTAVLGIVKAQQEAGAALLQNARTADQMREASRVFAQAGAACYDGLTLCKHRGDSLFTSDSIHTDRLRRAL
ncbi:MAG TPA: hypothetical protein VEU74_12185, partial [Gemmatimonadales bacterium]|nr:hypothetical protein [Gemmatimonadales bacterium]